MFRAAVSDLDISEGWVKCGHCRKVFDCRKNEIKPVDFVKEEASDDDADIDKDQQHSEQDVSTDDSGLVEEEQFVPQISLFDEADRDSNEDPETTPPRQADLADNTAQVRSGRSPTLPDPVATELVANKKDHKKPVMTPSIETRGGSERINSGLQVDKRSVASPSSSSGVSAKVIHKTSSTSAFAPQKQQAIKKQGQSESKLKNRLNISKPQAPAFSAIILAKAQSLKKQRNRFKKTKAFPLALFAVALFALLIWQIAIVNYTRLSQYGFISAPLSAVCSIVTCNQAAAPQALGFEILHASVRRHASVPNVMSVSATLINFSDENRLMPKLRLDLTNDDDAIIASRTIDLPENPHYVDPALTELAPGQDVQLLFNIENPDSSAHGFQLSLVAAE